MFVRFDGDDGHPQLLMHRTETAVFQAALTDSWKSADGGEADLLSLLKAYKCVRVCVIQPAHIHRETKPSVLLKAETYTVRQTDMWRNRIERGEWCSLLVADGRGSDTLLLLTTQSTLTEYKTYRPLLISQGAELLHWTNGWNLSCRKGALEKKVEDAISIKMLSLLFSWAH